MDDYLSVALGSPIATIIIGLLIEYGIVQPIKARLTRGKQAQPPNNNSAMGPFQNPVSVSPNSTSPTSAVYPYYYVAIGIVAAIMGAVSALIIPVVLDMLTMGAICLLPVGVIGALGGAILAVGIDVLFEMQQHAFYKRFPLAVILGFIGGWLGFIVLLVYAVYKDEGTKIVGSESSSDDPASANARQGRPINSVSPEYVAATFSIETCGFCKGKGTVINRPSCPGCGGKGSVRVYAPARLCGACKGTGRRNLSEVCPACEGSGWAHVIK